MNKEISRKLKTNKILSMIILFIGAILLIYMVKVEDEPGALPLFLILVGSLWLFVTHQQIKKSL